MVIGAKAHCPVLLMLQPLPFPLLRQVLLSCQRYNINNVSCSACSLLPPVTHFLLKKQGEEKKI